jgi:hypothetical protein
MSVNRYRPHVLVIPEDRADEQIANGFVLHDQVKHRQIQILPCAEGWSGVLHAFTTEYIPYLRNYQQGYVVLLIDFDGNYQIRRNDFEVSIPDDLKDRTFVIGASETPELLRQSLNEDWETIGLSLADECYKDTCLLWGHEQLKHNEPDRLRLLRHVKSVLFGA